MNSKFLKLFLLSISISCVSYSQHWRLGGNGQLPPIDAINIGNNFMGSTGGLAANNVPIRFGTFGINSMKLNATINYPVNTVAGARDGFLLLGADNAFSGGTLYGATGGAYSLLHLTSTVGAFAQEGGFRSWMRFGITSTHNQDLMWMGQRATGGLDITDAMICWADN